MSVINTNSKASKSSPLQKLAQKLYNTDASKNYLFGKTVMDDASGLDDALSIGQFNPLSFKKQTVELPKVSSVLASEPLNKSKVLPFDVMHFTHDNGILNGAMFGDVSGKSDYGRVNDLFKTDDIVDKSFRNIGTTGELLWENIKANPVESTAIAGLGLGNAYELFNDNKVGGQLAGLGLGGLASKLLLPKMDLPGFLPGAMVTLGGGMLGGMFDNYRADKEKEKEKYDALLRNTVGNYYG